jgi:hypothetical protein
MITGLRRITQFTQSSEFKSMRFQRARALANSETSDRFERALGLEQERLNIALEDLVQEAKNKGLFKEELDPRIIAVFIQSYTLGKIVDDIVPNPMAEEKWEDFIVNMLTATMVTQ